MEPAPPGPDQPEIEALRARLEALEADHGTPYSGTGNVEGIFRTLAESSLVGIYIVGAEDRFLYVNPKLEEILGYSQDELLHHVRLTDILHPDDLEKVRTNLHKRLTGEVEQMRYAVRGYRKDGHLIYAEVHGTRTMFDGKPAVMGVLLDVTKREQAYRALRESEQRYRLLMENANDAIFIAELETGDLVDANQKAQALIGRSLDEIRQMHQSDLHPPEQAEAARAKFLKKNFRKEWTPTEAIVLHRDGHRTPVEISSSIVEIGGRRLVQGIFRDITERRESEKALQRNAQLLHTLNSISNAILSTFSMDKIAEDTLAHLADLVPFVRASIIQFDLEANEAHLLAVRHKQARAPSLDAGQALPLAAFAGLEQYKKGSLRNMPDLAALPARSVVEHHLLEDGFRAAFTVPILTQGTLVGLISLAAEQPNVFTEDHHRMVREVAHLLALAFQQVRYEANLIAAREQAEEMARLKSAFLANMSHEIRTPLTSIIGYADVLAEEVGAEGSAFAKQIRKGGERLMQTLNSVLDLAQIESQSLKIDLRPVDAVQAAREAIDLFQGRAHERGVELVLETDRPRLWVLADQGALDRILSNLISNAIKFTDEGRITVLLLQDTAHVVLAVADTGIGIAPGFLPRLFEEFEQESSGTGRAFEGSGLGLTITKHLVALLNGTITVDSQPGEGTTFSIHLPAAEAVSATSVTVDGTADQARRRLLVVEDHVPTQRLLHRVLSRVHDTEVVGTLDAALAQAHKAVFDAVLLDINLGTQYTGVEVLEHLRQLPGYATVPAVACTAYVMPGDREQFLAAGFDAYVAKPFTKQQLFNALQQVFEKTATSSTDGS